jgi:hypothetical protein
VRLLRRRRNHGGERLSRRRRQGGVDMLGSLRGLLVARSRTLPLLLECPQLRESS